MFEVAAGYDYAAQIGRSALGLPTDRAAGVRPGGTAAVPADPGGPVAGGRADARSRRCCGPSPSSSTSRPASPPGQRVSRQRTLHLASFMVDAPDVSAARATTARVERALGIRLVPGYGATTGADRD